MPQLFIQIIIFVISLAVLVKSADVFTDAAEKIGRKLKMPSFIIGVTIVAAGTSLPELISSLIAVLKGFSEIVIGNVVGANIANLLLVTGIAALLCKKTAELNFKFSKLDIALFIFAPILLAISIWDGVFSFSEAVLCVAVFLIYGWSLARSRGEKKLESACEDLRNFGFLNIIAFAFSAAFLYFGAKYTVESVIRISEILKIGKEIIAISAVSIGTTLPEMMASVSAMRKNKPEIALGNVMGSTIFNILVVMGIPGLFGRIIIPSNIFKLALPAMLASALLYLFIIRDKKISKLEGWALLAFYIVFIGKLFALF